MSIARFTAKIDTRLLDIDGVWLFPIYGNHDEGISYESSSLCDIIQLPRAFFQVAYQRLYKLVIFAYIIAYCYCELGVSTVFENTKPFL